MSQLRIYADTNPNVQQCLTDATRIAAELAPLGIQYERWTASQALTPEAGQAEVLAAYQADVDRLVAQFGFQAVDVVSLTPAHPQKAALREKFLAEHIHEDFEVRFFVAGQGLFYIHAANQVYGMLCEAGDLLCIPARVTHWFDMGPEPDFKCIRFFTTPEGWVAQFTGSDIARHYPRHEPALEAA